MHKLALLLFASILALASAAVFAQSGSFIVSQHGTVVGSASFSRTATPKGVDSSSVVHVEMKGLNYSLSKAESLSPANHLRTAQLSATVNGSAVSVNAAPDASQLVLNIAANGHSTATRLVAHGSAVFLPDFDPGALDTLLALAAANNNRNVWAIIPKQAGSVVPVQLATYADEQGTLNGKPVTVHHIIATIAGGVTDLFSGPDDQLLQAELPQAGFALVRKGFVLTPPAKPGAPPTAAPAAPSAGPRAE
jgi:hypothetical protein